MMLDNLTRILLEKYQPSDPRLFEVGEPSESVEVQKSLTELPDSLKDLIASEFEKARLKKLKDSQ
jgi:hypothetical protein